MTGEQRIRAANALAIVLCREAGIPDWQRVAAVALGEAATTDRHAESDRIAAEIARRLAIRPAARLNRPLPMPGAGAATISLIAYRAGIPVRELVCRQRVRSVRAVRSAAAYVMRTHDRLSWPAIAAELRVRTGTAAMLGAVGTRLVASDSRTAALVTGVIAELAGGDA